MADTDAGDFWAQTRAAHPPLRAAIVADARITRHLRGEGDGFRSRWDTAVWVVRLAWTSDAFLAQVLYRVKARLQARRIPLAPRIAHRLAMSVAQVCIGDPVVMEPGVYLLHGQVVIDGIVRIGAGAVIGPWTTIGLRAGNLTGPTLGAGVNVGTGAKVIGPVHVGDGATIGAGAVVVSDVAPAATVVGAPARPVGGNGTIEP